MYKAAKWYADNGWLIFPVVAKGKEPLTPHGFEDASCDQATIREWWKRWPDANIGLACGPSTFIALDCDPNKYGDGAEAFIKNLEDNHPTTTQTTPTLGIHFLYTLPQGVDIGNSSGDLPPGIDVRVKGYILLTPSCVRYEGKEAETKGVPDGHEGEYAWAISLKPTDLLPQPVPKHVLDLLQKEKKRPVTIDPPPTPDSPPPGADRYAQAALKKELDALARTPEGDRNNQLNISAFSLGQLVGAHVLDETEVVQKLGDTAHAIGLDEKEVVRTIKSGLSKGIQNPRVIPETPKLIFANGKSSYTNSANVHESELPENLVYKAEDGGILDVWMMLHSDKWMYVTEFGKWYYWTNSHWQEDNGQTIKGEIQTLMQQLNDEARRRKKEAGDDKDAAKIADAYINATKRSRSRIESIEGMARPFRHVSPDMLDQHPMLLPCKNGTLDMASGELLAANPDHYITKCIDIEYDPDATCPLWEKFLARIMDNDLEMVSFIQRLIGHALTGDAGEKYLVFLWGQKGNNGKTTLVETVMRLLGPYAMKSPTEMIMTKAYRGGIPNDIARLRGVRFTVTNEVDAGMSFSESIIKDLTGRDTLTARFMRAEFFDFVPTHKLWIYGNHKPEIKGTDDAIWDRVKTVEFSVQIPENERDPLMQDKLARELPGILAWAVRGNFIWQKTGIQTPKKVDEATDKYQEEQDTIGQFVTECCDLDIEYEVSASTLYQAYEVWSKQLGLRPESGTKFGGEMSRRGHAVKRASTGKLRLGLRLNEHGRALGPDPTPHWSDEK